MAVARSRRVWTTAAGALLAAALLLVLAPLGLLRLPRSRLRGLLPGPARPPVRPLLRGDLPLPAAALAAGVSLGRGPLSLHIRKAERVLTVMAGRTAVKEYRIGLGQAPVGTKIREGDSKTPEGEYYVCTRLRQSRFHRFLGLSYPNGAAADRGLREGRITPAQRRAIRSAGNRRTQPPWNTPLGGAVGIHGGGGSSDWTLGCIAVEDSEIEELFAVLRLGTPVHIAP
ncbi:MAG: L,D-transpeptidase [Armatimonadetes bacterium]|nr:L,D-transpeptidase [Armatimonadota bacterium]